MPSPRYHREIPPRFRLEAGKCAGCGRVSYPARKVCPACRGQEMEAMKLSPRGKVVTSTVKLPETSPQLVSPLTKVSRMFPGSGKL